MKSKSIKETEAETSLRIAAEEVAVAEDEKANRRFNAYLRKAQNTTITSK